MSVELIPPIVKNGFKKLLRPIIRLFVRYKLNPNWLTTVSCFIFVLVAIEFARGRIRLAACLLLIGGIFDMIDGAVARASNRVTRFGALYDSTLDRYAEILTFFGIGYYFIHRAGQGFESGLFVSMVVFIALAGSLMVSYVRARSEALDFECKVGVMQRPERLVVLAAGALISDRFLVYALILIALLSNFTAIQRVYHIWAVEKGRRWQKMPTDIPHE
ncbi:CDP-alcohol phosphatidyltransferase family protein [candidate division KSB1 bacterium]|nr:CDP-alcohol phosphatidyltransferase family protein [candidate division KSB1 bacterium]